MKLLTPLLALLALLVVVSALDRTPPRADFVFINRGDVFTLDPQRMSYLQDFRMAYALYEGLTRWNHDDFQVEPAVATEWSISEDRLTYRFRLRPDARWSNGDPVTAHDFAYSWLRAMLPDTAADYSNLFFVIDGAEALFHWRTAELERFARESPARGGAPTIARRLWAETEQRYAQSVGVRALDDHTLEVRLRDPTPYFLDLLCFGPFYPVHRPTAEGWAGSGADGAARRRPAGWHAEPPPDWSARRWMALDADSGRVQQRHGWTKPPRLVSNGPYVLTTWRYKRDMRLERNPLYHTPTLAGPTSIAAVAIDDAATGVLAFETGAIDWVSDVLADVRADMLREREAYERRHALRISAMLREGLTMDEVLAGLPEPERGERRNIHAFPTFGTDFYNFNCRPSLADGRANPFADARVRRAFTLSVDKEAIVRRVTRLNEPVATTFIPPDTIPGYRSPAGLPYDSARARAELAAAGWSDRRGDGRLVDQAGLAFPVVDLLYSTNSPRYRDISLVLKAMWETQLGVRVELRGKDSKFYKDDLKNGNFMVARGGWYGDYGDPTTFLDICRTNDGNNDRGYSSPVVDGLLEQASREPDAGRRLRLLEECERVLMDEDVPMLVLCRFMQLYMYEPGRVSGLTTHPRLVQYLWKMRVQPPS